MDRVMVSIGGVELILGTDVLIATPSSGTSFHILTKTMWDKLVEELNPEIRITQVHVRRHEFDYDIYTVYFYDFKGG